MNNENLKHFEILKKINVSDKIEKKGKFSYLSWCYAVEEMTKACPEWIYEIEHFNNLPYIYDEKTGYMVFTNITAFGIKKRMWLPVMDIQNKAKKTADMMDINKTIMRCLVKNIAMFGPGLYIFAGEDLPEESTQEAPQLKENQEIAKPEIKINFEALKKEFLDCTNETFESIYTKIKKHFHSFTPEQQLEFSNLKKSIQAELSENR